MNYPFFSILSLFVFRRNFPGAFHTFHPEIFTKCKKIYTHRRIGWKSNRRERENFQRGGRNQFRLKKKTNPISETRIGIKYSFLLCRTRTSLGGAQSSWKKLDADKRRRRRGRGASKGKLFCVEKSRMLVSRKWICRVEKRRLEL